MHKKLCIPLPGIFQRGRLYKAQSCSSILRDKITPPTSSGCQSANTGRHSALFAEKTRVLRNCLGSRHIGSDGDINQNSGKTGHPKLLPDIYAISVCGDEANHKTIPKTSSSTSSSTTNTAYHHHHHHHHHHQHRHCIGDASLCSSKC